MGFATSVGDIVHTVSPVRVKSSLELIERACCDHCCGQGIPVVNDAKTKRSTANSRGGTGFNEFPLVAACAGAVCKAQKLGGVLIYHSM